MAGQDIIKFSHQEVKSLADSRYDVRKDVLDPQTRQPLNKRVSNAHVMIYLRNASQDNVNLLIPTD